MTKFVRPFELNPPQDTYKMLIAYVKHHAGIEYSEAKVVVDSFMQVLVDRIRKGGKVKFNKYFRFKVQSKIVPRQIEDVIELTAKQVYTFLPGAYMLKKCLPELNYASMRVISEKAKDYGKNSKEEDSRYNNF